MKLKHYALIAVVALTACKEPTIPEWDVSARLPAVSDTITIASFLPEDVVFDGEAIILPNTTISKEIFVADICSACTGSGTFPIPSFSYDDEVSLEVPDDLISTRLRGGLLRMSIENHLPHDILMNEDGESGRVAFELVDPSGSVVASDFVDGQSNPLASGDKATLEIDLAGVVFETGVTARLRIEAAGSKIAHPLDASSGFTYEISTENLMVDEVTIRQSGLDIEKGVLELSLSDDFREKISGGIAEGRLEFDVLFPFEIKGNLELGLANSATSLDNENWVALSSGRFDDSQGHIVLIIERDQLDVLLNGEKVFIQYSGSIEPGELTLSVQDQIIFEALLDVTYTVNRS